MMRVRYCPECKKKLFSFDHFFCSRCGAKLPDALVLAPQAPKSEIVVSPMGAELEKEVIYGKPEKSVLGVFGKLDKRFFVALAVASVVVGLILSSKDLARLTSAPRVQVSVPESSASVSDVSSRDTSRLLDSGIKLATGSFGEKLLADHLPSDIDLYIESFDEVWLGFLDVSEAPPDFPFVLFSTRDGSERIWGVVFGLENNFVGGLDLEEPWKVATTDEVIVISNSEYIASLVENVENKIIKSLSLDPKYVMALNKVPEKEGSAKIIFFNYEGKNALEELKGMYKDEATQGLVTRVLDFGYNELTVN